MDVYAFDKEGYFVGHTDIVVPEGCPEPNLAPGLTKEPPPPFDLYQIPWWDGSKWAEIRNDYRFATLYSWDRTKEVDVGKIKPGMTLKDLEATDIPPPDDTYIWDYEKEDWVQDPELARQAKQQEWEDEIGRRKDEIAAPIETYQDQYQTGQPTIITEEEYLSLLDYRVKLNTIVVLAEIPSCPVPASKLNTHAR